MSGVRTRIAGIAIPDSALAHDATEFVRDAATQLLFDHSRRVFLWASLQAERLSVEYDAELVYVGASSMTSACSRATAPRASASRSTVERRPCLPRAPRTA
jgi:hypothetical protein